MILPRGVAQPAELVKHVEALAPFPAGVVNFRYTVENDWSGDPAIFFGSPYQMKQLAGTSFPERAEASWTLSLNVLTRLVNGI
jgi:hypothetical protein